MKKSASHLGVYRNLTLEVMGGKKGVYMEHPWCVLDVLEYEGLGHARVFFIYGETFPITHIYISVGLSRLQRKYTVCATIVSILYLA